ncbi:dUTP diphosphatase [Peribacillus simplex]|uniref:dUTP diphosphatase n=1 Tax=Peribacillus simplex TaxID=1478 RepID=UPI00351D87B4
MRIRIKKVRDDIPTPGYAYTSDAGYDLIAGEDVIIQPGETVKIPTGLAFEIAEGYEMQVRPRSGVTSKTPLRIALGTIDASYRGEVSVICDNTVAKNDSPQIYFPKIIGGCTYDNSRPNEFQEGTYIIRKGDRIAQGIIAPVVHAKFEVVDELDETTRGTGGFGSSGVKTSYDKAVSQNGGALERLAKEGE